MPSRDRSSGRGVPSDLNDRFRGLSPQQRELLRLRLKARQVASAEAEGETVESSDAVDRRTRKETAQRTASPSRAVDFSLFFFSADSAPARDPKYRLLIESAKFADSHGFKAIWTPERHFQVFGGLYPNPSVLSAGLAMITENIEIRAGSVVLPLHSPVRVAEEWAVVDQLSGGRVGLSFASGWHEEDALIAPAPGEDRRELMFRNIETVRRLWAGENVAVRGPDGVTRSVTTYPRPVQAELEFWVTANSTTTWQRSAEIGANVLTALVGGGLHQLSRNIRLYRETLAKHGHDPRSRVISLMLHTYLGTDLSEVKEKVRMPLIHYLKDFVNQSSKVSGDETASPEGGDLERVLEFAFERYFNYSSLIGTPDKCSAMIEELIRIGVDEIACLVDFGLDLESTLSSLRFLDELRKEYGAEQRSRPASE